MRNVQAAQIKMKGLQESLDECKSRRSKVEKEKESILSAASSKRKTGTTFLIIGIIAGLIFISYNTIGGIACIVAGLLIFILARRSASSKEDDVYLAQEQMTRIDEEIAQHEKAIEVQQAIIDQPFDDIDLLNMDMTPENIALLENEVKLLFQYKIDHPSFLIGKSCWLLKYAQLNFFEKSEEEEKKHDACMDKLENSGSWILKIARLYCVAYFGSFGMQVINSALIRDKSGNSNAVSKDSLDLATILNDLRPAETPEEDAFIMLLMDALSVNDETEVADVFVDPKGLEKYLMPDTPETLVKTRQEVERRVATHFQTIQENRSAYDLLRDPNHDLVKECMNSLNSKKQKIWLEDALTKVNTAEETEPSLYTHLIVTMWGFLISFEESFSDIEPRIDQLLADIAEEYSRCIRRVEQAAEDKMDSFGWSSEQKRNFRQSAQYISSLHSAGQEYISMLSSNGVSSYSTYNGSLHIGAKAAFEYYIHTKQNETTTDCLGIEKILPAITIGESEKKFLTSISAILHKYKVTDSTIEKLINN